MDFILEIIYLAMVYRVYPPAILIETETIKPNAINCLNRPTFWNDWPVKNYNREKWQGRGY